MTMDSHLTRNRREASSLANPTTTVRGHRGPHGLALGAATPVVSAAPAAAGSVTQAVLTWNENAVKAAVDSCLSPANHPLHEARMYAMTQAAVHGAERDRSPLQGVPPGACQGPGASPEAAVASAARNVLVPVLQELPDLGCTPGIPGAVDGVEAAYAASLAAIPNGNAKTKGVALGQAAAAAIVQQRQRRLRHGRRGSELPAGHQAGRVPLHARDTVRVRTRMGRGHTVRAQVGEPVPTRSSAVADLGSLRDFREIKRLGGDDVTTPSDRTADQTQIALFWLESSPSQWNRIARTVAQAAASTGGRPLGAGSPELGARRRIHRHVRDKYHYKFWRPVTAIQLAGTDGNHAPA